SRSRRSGTRPTKKRYATSPKRSAGSALATSTTAAAPARTSARRRSNRPTPRRATPDFARRRRGSLRAQRGRAARGVRGRRERRDRERAVDLFGEVDDAALHDEAHLADGGDVLRRVAVDQEEVGELAAL